MHVLKCPQHTILIACESKAAVQLVVPEVIEV